MYKKYVTKYIILLIILAFYTGCGSDPKNPAGPGPSAELTLNINRLKNLDTGAVYEGWIIYNGSPISTGTFTVNNSGQLSQSVFDVEAAKLTAATAFVVTVELTSGPATPSNTKILAGNFSGNTANLTTSDAMAIGVNMSSLAGKYLLATPTTSEPGDSLSGIWYMKTDNTAGLNFPVPNTGWVYQGWVIMNGLPVSTGKFVNVNEADSTRPYSGNLPGPNFPGEDFYRDPPPGLSFPTNLRNMITVISIEPSPDNSIAPFFLQPLQHYIPFEALHMVNYDLDNQSSVINPIGIATR